MRSLLSDSRKRCCRSGRRTYDARRHPSWSRSPGNNISLRLGAMSGRIDTDVELVGEQHDTLEETFPE